MSLIAHVVGGRELAIREGQHLWMSPTCWSVMKSLGPQSQPSLDKMPLEEYTKM